MRRLLLSISCLLLFIRDSQQRGPPGIPSAPSDPPPMNPVTAAPIRRQPTVIQTTWAPPVQQTTPWVQQDSSWNQNQQQPDGGWNQNWNEERGPPPGPGGFGDFGDEGWRRPPWWRRHHHHHWHGPPPPWGPPPPGPPPPGPPFGGWRGRWRE